MCKYTVCIPFAIVPTVVLIIVGSMILAAQQIQYHVAIIKQVSQDNGACMYYYRRLNDSIYDSPDNNIYKIYNAECGLVPGNVLYLCKSQLTSNDPRLSIQACQNTSQTIGIITTVSGAAYGVLWIFVFITCCLCNRLRSRYMDMQLETQAQQTTPQMTQPGGTCNELVAFVSNPSDIKNLHVAKDDSDRIAVVVHP